MEESWIKHYWRPTVAYSYIVVTVFDFVLAPIMNALLSYYSHSTYIPWSSLTLSAGGFYHLSMGAIIGVAAWSRGQEKIRRLMTGEEIETDTTTQTPKK